MAVPHVTGAVARIWADFPNCNSETVRSAIESTAKDLGPAGKDNMFGAGLLQTEAAYDWLARQPCAVAGFTDERGQKKEWQESRQGQQQQAAKEGEKQEKGQGQVLGEAKTAAAAAANGGNGPQTASRNLLQQQQQ
jgi:hypothetical protein